MSRYWLLRTGGIKKSANGGDAIGRKTYSLSVFMDNCLVGGEVDAIHFVASNVAMEPLDLRTHTFQNVNRLLSDFPQLGIG